MAFTIAELLVEVGMDTTDADKAAKRIKDGLEEVAKSGENAGKGLTAAQLAAKRLKEEAKAAKEATKKLREETRKFREGVRKAAKVQRELAREVARTAKKFETLSRGARVFSAGIAKALTIVTATVAGLGFGVLRTAGKFEKLRIQLKTVTGSVEEADDAFKLVRDFAKKTPFEVEELTNAFVRLRGAGVEPTAEVLRSIGDTASATGRTINQFTEAILDAQTFQFERLREFNISTRTFGQEIEFTFQGVKTRVGKDAGEINDFLLSIGKTNFAGAMADQSLTLIGVISNAKDAMAEFFDAVAELGPLEEFKALVRDITDSTEGEEGLAKALADTLTSAIRLLRRVVKGDLLDVLKTVAKVLEVVINNFDKLIGLFAAAKTFQAFQAMASGFTAMGFAAAGALGPIGLIAAAVAALVPVAIDAGVELNKAFRFSGKALGASLAQQSQIRVSSRAGRFEQEIAIDKASLAGEDPKSFAARELRANIARNERGLAEAQKQQVKAKADAKVAADLAKAEARGRFITEAQERGFIRGDDFERFEGFEAKNLEDEARIRELDKLLGIVPGQPLTRDQERVKNTAIPKLLAGQSPQQAINQSDKDLRKKGPKKKRALSLTTIADVIRASATGELQDLADRTPSAKGIEPTVAIDITNNNVKVEVAQTIKGVVDPVAAGVESGKQIRKVLDTVFAAAGQVLQPNIIR